MNLEVKHCCLDLKDYIEGLRARLKRNAEASSDYPSMVQKARFDATHWTTLDLMNELERIIASWEEGFPARSSTQIEIGKKR